MLTTPGVKRIKDLAIMTQSYRGHEIHIFCEPELHDQGQLGIAVNDTIIRLLGLGSNCANPGQILEEQIAIVKQLIDAVINE